MSEALDRAAFARDGWQIFDAGLCEAVLDELCDEFARLLAGGTGRSDSVRAVLEKSARVAAVADELLPCADRLLGESGRATKATLFDKTPDANWLVPWHQDLTVTVSEPIDDPDFTHWRQRDGVWHVQPPKTVLEKTVALRLHLDPCPPENGALRVIPRSHCGGVLSESEKERQVKEGCARVTPADRGAVLAMAPLLLHASSKAEVAGHRRVLHLEYSSAELPAPLRWSECQGVSD